jgi:hypothetical protein
MNHRNREESHLVNTATVSMSLHELRPSSVISAVWIVSNLCLGNGRTPKKIPKDSRHFDVMIENEMKFKDCVSSFPFAFKQSRGLNPLLLTTNESDGFHH